MRTLAIITTLLMLPGLATAQDDPAEAPTHTDIQQLNDRIAELEATQAALLARIERLEAMRVRELETLLNLYQQGAPGPAAADSPAAPTGANAVATPANGVASNGEQNGEENGDGAAEEEVAEEEQSPVAAFIETAKNMIDEESFAASIRILNVAIDLEPNNDEAYFYRGVARHLMTKYEESLEDFQTAYALSSTTSMRYTCLYNQACVFALTGDVARCLEYLERSYEAGFQDIVMQMATDPDLDGVRGNREFRDLLWKLKNP